MGFSKKDVEDLSAALGEPGWVLDHRLQAWDTFTKMELPGEKEEPWRYTNLAMLRLKLDRFSPVRSDQIRPRSPSEAPAVPEGRSARIDLTSGGASVACEDPTLESKGVVVTDLASAMREHEELVRKHLFSEASSDSHIFTALHAALFSGGAFVYVPRGVTVELPIDVQVHVEDPAVAFMPHNLVIVEEGGELCVLEHFVSGAIPSDSLSNSALEVIARQASRVFVTTIEDFGERVWHFQQQRFAAAKDANLKSLVLTLGGRFSRSEISAALRGEGIGVQMLGLYLASGKQHFDFRTLQDHVAPHCTSDLLFKGALRDESRAVYSGLIHVRPGGAGTDAYQTNRNLVLSDRAKADSKPELEIENNDVRCSHAASVGQINEEEVFYLQARGIDRAQAERLIVQGFFEEVLGRLGRPDIVGLARLTLEGALTR
ncbi:MAG: Fe-S cluster assembly protein SufD [Actinomycetota bacterium]|nr:Fe-S cluster assembly protein SufD [Actinomycetota bacterium]